MIKFLSSHEAKFILCFKEGKIIIPTYCKDSKDIENCNQISIHVNNLLNEQMSCQEFYNHTKYNRGVWIGRNTENLIIYTDIYGTLPSYLYKSEELVAVFTHFQDLFENFNDIKLTPDPVGITEALFFDNSINLSTNFKEIQFLPPASIISIGLCNNEVSIFSYNSFSFSELGIMSHVEVGKNIAEKLLKALRGIKTDRILLPLSGGIDSRLLAAALTKIYDPKSITAVSFACKKSSYEIKYAHSTCEILGIKDWRFNQLTEKSYIGSKNILPYLLGGGLGIQHGHLYSTLLSLNLPRIESYTLVSGAFADAAGGYGVQPVTSKYHEVEQSFYFKRLLKIDNWVRFDGVQEMIKKDIIELYTSWLKGSIINSFDEYCYFTQRQSRCLFTQSLIYKDILPVCQPYTDTDLSEFLIRLPFKYRKFKRGIRSALKYLNPELYKLPDISSLLPNESKKEIIYLYKGKVLNNTCRILTWLTKDRYLFFSPYQTECQDYLLRTSHRQMALEAMQVLQQYGLLTYEQATKLNQKPHKQFGGGLLPTAQYWAITIASVLNKLEKQN